MLATAMPSSLYTSEQLLAGFNPSDPLGFLGSWDLQVFHEFVKAGGASPRDAQTRIAHASHDAHIADALREYLSKSPVPRLVGIMGGHKLDRSHAAYVATVHLARRLTRAGFTIASGGGPGAMEASHVGALFAEASDHELNAALARLAADATLPRLNDLILPDGTLNETQIEQARLAHRWLLAALEAKAMLNSAPAASLAIPTWLYGQEPTMPFATSYAKYFHNSIREEALVTESRAGIIYARGGGGTIREIFQDVEQNYYAKAVPDFTPMVFFDPDNYWERDSTFDSNGDVVLPGVRLDTVLASTFKLARARARDYSSIASKVLFTTDQDAVLALLETHAPAAQANLLKAIAAAPNLRLAMWNRE